MASRHVTKDSSMRFNLYLLMLSYSIMLRKCRISPKFALSAGTGVGM
jgi:hypothetical protein